jgi:hypothetical protein
MGLLDSILNIFRRKPAVSPPVTVGPVDVPTVSYEAVKQEPAALPPGQFSRKMDIGVTLTGSDPVMLDKLEAYFNQFPEFRIKSAEKEADIDTPVPGPNYLKLAKQIIKYIPINALGQMTLADFTETMRSPSAEARAKYGLSASGFGGIKQEHLESIYNYGDAKGWDVYEN